MGKQKESMEFRNGCELVFVLDRCGRVLFLCTRRIANGNIKQMRTEERTKMLLTDHGMHLV